MSVHKGLNKTSAISPDKTATATLFHDSQRLIVITNKGADVDSAIAALTELRAHLNEATGR